MNASRALHGACGCPCAGGAILRQRLFFFFFSLTIEDEADALVLASCARQHGAQILVEVFGAVVLVNLDLWTRGHRKNKNKQTKQIERKKE